MDRMKNRQRAISIKQATKVHLVGIKGVGMTGLAQILKVEGIRVSGSDTTEEFFTDAVLKRLWIPVFRGFRASHIRKDIDFVIASTAYLKDRKRKREHGKWEMNPEIREAARKNIPILTYPEAVGEFFNSSYGIAVTGTHGKSTTAALLGVTLEALGLDPTALVGTMVNNWHTNARVSRGKEYGIGDRERKNMHEKRARIPYPLTPSPFVLEADEYREAFLHYHPQGIILTSIEYDHPDYFKTFAFYKKTFAAFLRRIKPNGFFVVCGDDREVSKVAKAAKAAKVLRYGFEKQNELRIKNYELRPDGVRFALFFRKKNLGAFSVSLYGEHNVLNAAAVVGCCLMLGQRPEQIRKALKKFRGTARRFEFLQSSYNAISYKAITHKTKKSLQRYSATALQPIIIDDYAHHPTEIRVTLKTARELFPEMEIIAVFQPHTYSRTRALMKEFAQSFGDADQVYILETYASAREKRNKMMTKNLTNAVAKYHSSVQYLPSIPVAIKMLQKTLRQYGSTAIEPVVLTLGAGDVWMIGKALARLTK